MNSDIIYNTLNQMPNLASATLFGTDQTTMELTKHKSLLKRSESLGAMGFWEYDLKTGKIWASSGARFIYGIDKQELTINDVRLIACSEYRPLLDQMLERLIHNEDKYEIEFKINRPDDFELVDVRSIAEYDACDGIVYGIIQDISKHKKVEHELIQARERAESNIFKSSLISNLSHEIRTPMNGIVGCVHLLTDMELDVVTRNEYKEIIHQCCDQLVNNVNDILDIAKIESGQDTVNKGQVNIIDIFNDINDIFSPLALKKELSLNIKTPLDTQIQPLFTDQIKLNKIITTLIENAIRYTSEGYVELGCKEYEKQVEFYVRDTGIGITTSKQEIIFQPYAQAGSQSFHENGGTGLGLTITKKYVKMLGGKIWFESSPGEGTTFRFTVPKISEIKTQKDKLPERKKADQLKVCLVVDDMEMNYIYLKSLITSLGFTVLWAKDGNEAIEMSVSDYSIDLVLMDLRLPHTDGYEATRIIKEKRPDLPIIAQSANALPEDREKALQSGCNDYISKPIYKEKFVQIIRSYFAN